MSRKQIILGITLLLGVTLALSGQANNNGTQTPPPTSAEAKLTNKDILGMIKAGLPADIILAKIQASECSFDTSPTALGALKSAGVPDEVILKMIVASSRTHTASANSVAQPTGRILDPMTALFEKRKNSVVTVWSEIGQGTGFIIDPDGLILTNQHVIGPSQYVAVQFDPKHKIPARILAADPARDVAVLWANTKAFEGSDAAPMAPWVSPPPVVVGEEVFTIGSPMGIQKILTTGIVSKIEAHAILSNININHGNSGGPLFNSRGEVVGITTFLDAHEPNGPGISGIVSLDEARPLIEKAKAAMKGTTPPPATLLPVIPTDPFPVQALKEDATQQKFDVRPYIFVTGKFNVAIITPPLEYWEQTQAQVSAVRGRERRYKKRATSADTIRPLDDLKNWAQYVGDYEPTIEIRLNPQLVQTFWSGFARGMAAAGGQYVLPAATLHYATDFKEMRLLCGSRVVTPISPGKIANLINVHNPFINVSDATYQGLYIYPPDAISPNCGQVKLEIYSEKDPAHPTTKVLSEKTVERVWEDFQPYRVQEASK